MRSVSDALVRTAHYGFWRLAMTEPASWLPPFMQESLRSTTERTIENPVWPNGARCAVSLHIHVDGQSVWRALNREKLVYISVGEYGPRTGVWRLLDLLARKQLKASFFVPGWTAETYPEVVPTASREGHEIGHHSYSHTVADMGLTEAGDWDRSAEEREFDRALEILRDQSGQEVVGYVPPGGELSPHTIEILVDRGIRYQAQCSADRHSLLGGMSTASRAGCSRSQLTGVWMTRPSSSTR